MQKKHPKLLLQEYILATFDSSFLYKLDKQSNNMWKPSVIIGEKIYTTNKTYPTKTEASNTFSQELYDTWTSNQDLSSKFASLSCDTTFDYNVENKLKIKIYSMDNELKCIEYIDKSHEELIELHNLHPFTHWVIDG